MDIKEIEKIILKGPNDSTSHMLFTTCKGLIERIKKLETEVAELEGLIQEQNAIIEGEIE